MLGYSISHHNVIAMSKLLFSVIFLAKVSFIDYTILARGVHNYCLNHGFNRWQLRVNPAMCHNGCVVYGMRVVPTTL